MKNYQYHITTARRQLREGKVIDAYDTLGELLELHNKHLKEEEKRRVK